MSNDKTITDVSDLPFHTGDTIRLYGHTNVPPDELTPWATTRPSGSDEFVVRCEYPVPTSPWLEFIVTVNRDGTISLQGHTDQEPHERSYVSTSRDDLSGPKGTGNYGIYCREPEPKHPWTSFYVKIVAEGIISLRGHTDRAHTETSYLATTLLGIEGSADTPTSYNVRAFEAAPKPPWTNFRLAPPQTPLEKIYNRPNNTPYPAYAAGTPEGKAYHYIKCDVLHHDPRQWYYTAPASVLNEDLEKLYNLSKTPPPGVDAEALAAVVAELICEYGAAIPVSALFASMGNIINTTFLGDRTRLEIAANYISMGSSKATLNIFAIFSSVVGIVSGITGPEGAGASLVLRSIFNILGQVKGVPGSITGVTTELLAKALTVWQDVLTQNSKMSTVILKDWGKSQALNDLINTGTITWPTSKIGEIEEKAGNAYEIKCWQALLPVKYRKEFSFYDYHDQDGVNYSECPAVWFDGSTFWWLVAGCPLYWWNPPDKDGMNRLFTTLGVEKADLYLSKTGWSLGNCPGVWNSPNCVPHSG